ncbi:MAG TPA: DsrE/DsrF/DrsH-like family protein [Methanomassiliicoccales archaeon]|nr:DsrE/DsrF/DrsH-like family protein [Methanomassiliicoccales archaeon]
MAKVAIVCNSTEPRCVFPTFVLGSSGLAVGNEVILFFTPGGGPILVKGELDKMKAKGLPDMKDLVEKVKALGGKIWICELCLEAKDLKPEQLMDGVEIVGATEFMAEASSATVTFSFG